MTSSLQFLVSQSEIGDHVLQSVVSLIPQKILQIMRKKLDSVHRNHCRLDMSQLIKH